MKSKLIGLIFFLSCSVQASTYSEQLQYFKNALKSSRFSDRNLEDYKNPRKGKKDFSLNEKHAPWAGNYFSMQDGGIAHRWQDTTSKYMATPLKLSQTDYLKMTTDQLSHLSPMEKYDLLEGDYNFTATEFELKNRGPLRDLKPQEWEGFCNGVRAAGILLPEPQGQITIKSKDGLLIPFSIADLKALAGASYFFVEKYSQLGAPTRQGVAESQPNAAVFDLALRFYLAEKKKAFVIDSHLGDEIWNESVIGYQRTLSGNLELTPEEKTQYPKATSKLNVNLMLFTLGEIEIKKSNTPTEEAVADGEHSETIISKYILYLDQQGRAIDGQWVNSQSKRGVDFAWFASGKGTDSTTGIGQSGNPYLDFDKVKELFVLSSKQIKCENLF